MPSGEIELDANGDAKQPSLGDDAQLSLLLEIAVLCNDASLDSAHEKGSGDPMELALLRAGFRAGIKRSALLQHSPIVHKHCLRRSQQNDGDCAPPR